jgi:rRNA maturation endonuclease Nob1
MLTKFLIIGIIVTGLGGALGFKLYIEAGKKLAVKELELKQTEATFTEYQDKFDNLSLKINKLSKENQAIILKDKETTRTLNNLRGREATVLAKKSLVSLKINKAYQKRERKVACMTGDFTLC